MSVKADILAAPTGRRPQRVPRNIHHDLLRQGSLEREMRGRGLGIIEKSVIPYQVVASHVAVEERMVRSTGRRD